MTRVLVPVWTAEGVQRLKVAPQGKSMSTFFSYLRLLPSIPTAFLPKPSPPSMTMDKILTRLNALDMHLSERDAAPPKPAHGLTPPALENSVHVTRCLAQLRSKDKSIEKYIYLSQLKDADSDMLYKICLENMSVSISRTTCKFEFALNTF